MFVGLVCFFSPSNNILLFFPSHMTVSCLLALTEQVYLFGQWVVLWGFLLLMSCILIVGAYIQMRDGERNLYTDFQSDFPLLYVYFPVHGERGRSEYPTVLVGSRQLPVSACCQKRAVRRTGGTERRHDLIRQVSLVGGGLWHLADNEHLICSWVVKVGHLGLCHEGACRELWRSCGGAAAYWCVQSRGS